MLDLPLPSADDIGLPPAIGPLLSHYLPDLVRFRRDIHKHPELSYEEYRTSEPACPLIAPRRRDGPAANSRSR